MTKIRVERVMPNRWFEANNWNKPICEITSGNKYRRALRDGERGLGPFILPPFQRGAVWTQAQQIKLIESIWGGLPVGAYVYNQILKPDHPCDGWLLDGQQRITAILAYANGDFPVFGWRFPDLPRPDQLGFEMTPIACLQTAIDKPDGCLEVYDRLVYGGTAHEPKGSAR